MPGAKPWRTSSVRRASGERQLVHVVVPVDPGGLAHRGPVHGVRHLEVGFLEGRVVGRVHDEAVDVGDGGAFDGGGLLELLGGGDEVGVPAEPAVVGRVDVVVDVGEGAEGVEGVPDALLVVPVRLHRGALGGRPGGAARVGDQVGQRVGFDEGDDAQARVGGVAEDGGDRVDVVALVAAEFGGAELSVGGEGGAVPAGEVVDDDLEEVGALAHGRVEVGAQAARAGGTADRGDAVHPDERRLVRDDAAARFGGGPGGPVGVHIGGGADVRVVDAGGGRCLAG